MEVVKDTTEEQTPQANPPEETVKSTLKGSRKPVKVKKEIRQDYSDAEITKMAHKLVAAMKDKERIKEEASAEAAKFKLSLAAKDAEIEELSGVITQGFQFVSVDSEMIRNFDTGNREWWYKGAIIETEPLNAKDHQMDIDDAEKANKEEAARIAKEEGANKTKELNDQAAKAAEEEANMTDDQKKQFDEFVVLADTDHKSKNYANAKLLYEAALKLKPNDKTVINKLAKTEMWIEKKAQMDKQ